MDWRQASAARHNRADGRFFDSAQNDMFCINHWRNVSVRSHAPLRTDIHEPTSHCTMLPAVIQRRPGGNVQETHRVEHVRPVCHVEECPPGRRRIYCGIRSIVYNLHMSIPERQHVRYPPSAGEGPGEGSPCPLAEQAPTLTPDFRKGCIRHMAVIDRMIPTATGVPCGFRPNLQGFSAASMETPASECPIMIQ